MERDLVKRMVKKDGSQRISFYQDVYAENPRDMTDEPLHCEDWSREYSIMNKQEREYRTNNARTCIERLAGEFGDYKKIIDSLVENGKHMTDGNSVCNNALVYDNSLHGWALKEYTKWYGEKEYNWKDASFFDGKKYDIDLYTLLDVVLDGTIDYIAENCMTDKAKIMSYGFGYHGDISFYHGFSTDSEGICWLEKDEFLKYSGGDNSEWIKKEEQVWKEKTLDEIEFLIDELKAWCDNDVYGFVVEDAVRIQGIKTYYNGKREDEPYIDTQWEESDSCWGYYGDIDEVKVSMFDQAGLDINEFEEENV